MTYPSTNRTLLHALPEVDWFGRGWGVRLDGDKRRGIQGEALRGGRWLRGRESGNLGAFLLCTPPLSKCGFGVKSDVVRGH